MLGVLTLIYTLTLVALLMKSTEKGMKLIIYMMYAVPFSSCNRLFEQLSLGNIAGFDLNIIIITAGILFLFTIFRYRKIQMDFEFKILILLFISYFLGLSVSSNWNNALQDYNKFFIQIIWGVCFYLFLKRVPQFNVDRWYWICLNAQTLGCIIFMVGKMLGYRLIFDVSMVVYGANDLLNGAWVSGCLIMSFGYMGYVLSTGLKIINKKLKIIELCICTIYLAFFQQSRVVFAGCIGAFIVSYLFVVFSDKRLSRIQKNILIVGCACIAIPFILKILENSDIYVINKLFETDIFSKNDTLITRINTITYYMGQIKLKYFTGYGFGVKIPLVNQYGRFHGIGSFYTDNALINVGMKSGVISLIIFIILWITPIIRYMKYKELRKDMLYVCMCVTYSIFLVESMLMTSQINHQYMVNFGMINNVMILYFLSKKSIKKLDKQYVIMNEVNNQNVLTSP